MDAVRISGVDIPFQVLPHLWAVVRTCLQEDGDHLEPGDALDVLRRIATVFRFRRSRIRKACNFSQHGAHNQLLKRLADEAIEFRKHINNDGELDGEESDDVSASREWLEKRYGPGSTLSPQDATVLHEFITGTLASDGYESDDEESSYVVHEGPVYNVVQVVRLNSCYALH